MCRPLFWSRFFFPPTYVMFVLAIRNFSRHFGNTQKRCWCLERVGGSGFLEEQLHGARGEGQLIVAMLVGCMVTPSSEDAQWNRC